MRDHTSVYLKMPKIHVSWCLNINTQFTWKFPIWADNTPCKSHTLLNTNPHSTHEESSFELSGLSKGSPHIDCASALRCLCPLRNYSTPNHKFIPMSFPNFITLALTFITLVLTFITLGLFFLWVSLYVWCVGGIQHHLFKVPFSYPCSIFTGDQIKNGLS